MIMTVTSLDKTFLDIYIVFFNFMFALHEKFISHMHSRASNLLCTKKSS